MELKDLYGLKGEYEKELVLAEAKVKVINDLIAIAEDKEKPVEEPTTDESEVGFAPTTAIY